MNWVSASNCSIEFIVSMNGNAAIFYNANLALQLSRSICGLRSPKTIENGLRGAYAVSVSTARRVIMLERILAAIKHPITHADQPENEALIKLATFFYKVDGRITLEEQEYIHTFIREVPWSSTIDVEVFQEQMISVVNQVLARGPSECMEFLAQVMDSIKTEEGIAKAKAVAKEVSDVDSEIADDETRYLEFVLTY